MPKKLLYFLLIFCFINPLFSQLNDEKTYFFKDKNDKEGQIVYSKARTDGLNWKSYRFDSDRRPNKQKVVQIVAKKVRHNPNIASRSATASYLKDIAQSIFIAEYQNDYAFTAYSKYSNGSIKEMGRMLKRKTNLLRCNQLGRNLAAGVLDGADKSDYNCNEEKEFKKIKLKPKHSKKMPVYPDIIVKYGEWKGYHSNGTLSYKVQYRNGFPQSGYTFFPSGYVESFLGPEQTIAYKESDKKVTVIEKNEARALSLVTEKHNSKFGDKAKEITVLSKDNLVSVKNSEGYYEGNYTSFVFQADYTELESGYETYTDWNSVNYVYYLIRTRLGEEPTAETKRNTIQNHTSRRYVEKEIVKQAKYQVKCSSGKCEIIK